jgi:hypothetical protein
MTWSRVVQRLLELGADVHVDFHANRYFDDFWCFPGHFDVSMISSTRVPNRFRVRSRVKQRKVGRLISCCSICGIDPTTRMGGSLARNKFASSFRCCREDATLTRGAVGATE